MVIENPVLISYTMAMILHSTQITISELYFIPTSLGAIAEKYLLKISFL